MYIYIYIYIYICIKYYIAIYIYIYIYIYILCTVTVRVAAQDPRRLAETPDEGLVAASEAAVLRTTANPAYGQSPY